MKLMKQIHLFKKGFVIFLKGATFSDFFETKLSNCKPLAIRIRFPLFWGIFFQLGSNLIKKCSGNNILTFKKIRFTQCDKFLYLSTWSTKRQLFWGKQNNLHVYFPAKSWHEVAWFRSVSITSDLVCLMSPSLIPIMTRRFIWCAPSLFKKPAIIKFRLFNGFQKISNRW